MAGPVAGAEAEGTVDRALAGRAGQVVVVLEAPVDQAPVGLDGVEDTVDRALAGRAAVLEARVDQGPAVPEEPAALEDQELAELDGPAGTVGQVGALKFPEQVCREEVADRGPEPLWVAERGLVEQEDPRAEAEAGAEPVPDIIRETYLRS